MALYRRFRRFRASSLRWTFPAQEGAIS